MSRKVIDISVWNSGSTINWDVLRENVDGIIIRVGYRGYGSAGTLKTDKKFKEYADKCMEYKIPFGVYWFAQDITQIEAIESAKYVVTLLKPYQLSYPVYYDVEYSGAKNNTGRADSLNKTMRTNCAIAFCEQIKSAGYESGVYASEDWFNNMLFFDKLKKYSIWCAKWNTDNGKPENEPTIKYDMWQYTSKGNITGIKGHIDISLDESGFINRKKTITEIAYDVIKGKYGNGKTRKNRLIKEGYEYEKVQAKVNEILKSK